MSIRLISKLPSRHGKFALGVRALPSSSASFQPGISQQRHTFSSLSFQSSIPTSSITIKIFPGDGNHQIRCKSTSPRQVSNDEPELLYEGPMNRLITTLKTFSLSSALLSTIGLPSMMMIKGIDMYTGIHIAMVGTTVAGSIGSTLGLQWIFAPYVYTLERIPTPKTDHGDSELEKATQVSDTANEGFLLRATTRSIFLGKIEHIFDPVTDIKGVPGGTIRPFCSFLANHNPLYIHEQMIEDPKLSQHLFINNATPIKQYKNPDPDKHDDEFF